MKLTIQKGRITRPQKVVLYAPEGVGKSTLASQLPAPLFLDLEQGTHQLDVARIEPDSWGSVEQVLTELSKDNNGFETLVIDTADWLEELAIKQVCLEGKKDSIEDFGYGKGYTYVAEKFVAFLTHLDGVIRNGINVVILAHSTVKKFERPDTTSSYDRYELKLHKLVAPLLKEWSDALLFGNYRVKVAVKDEDAKGRKTGLKNKAYGGKERQLFCSHNAAWDAKNRHGLEELEPWSVETLTRIFAPNGVAVEPTPAAEPTNAPLIGDDTVPMDPLPDWQKDFFVLLDKHVEAATAFLRKKKEIGPNNGLTEVNEKYARRVLANPAGFFKAAGIPVTPSPVKA